MILKKYFCSLPFHSADNRQLTFQLVVFRPGIFNHRSQTCGSDQSQRSGRSGRLELSRSCQKNERASVMVLVVMSDCFSMKTVLIDDDVMVARRSRFESTAATFAGGSGIAFGTRRSRRSRR